MKVHVSYFYQWAGQVKTGYYGKVKFEKFVMHFKLSNLHSRAASIFFLIISGIIQVDSFALNTFLFFKELQHFQLRKSKSLMFTFIHLESIQLYVSSYEHMKKNGVKDQFEYLYGFFPI